MRDPRNEPSAQSGGSLFVTPCPSSQLAGSRPIIALGGTAPTADPAWARPRPCVHLLPVRGRQRQRPQRQPAMKGRRSSRARREGSSSCNHAIECTLTTSTNYPDDPNHRISAPLRKERSALRSCERSRRGFSSHPRHRDRRGDYVSDRPHPERSDRVECSRFTFDLVAADTSTRSQKLHAGLYGHCIVI